MSFWGYVGGAALLGLAGFLTGGAALVAAGAGAFLIAKPTLEKWTDTPKNDAQKLGIDPNKLYEDNKKYHEDTVKYHEEREKEVDKEIKNLNQEIKAKEEEKTQVGKQAENTDDPEEKQRLLGIVSQLESDINSLKQQRDNKIEEKKETKKKLDELHTNRLGNANLMTKAQFMDKASTIPWGSIKTYVVIFIVIAVVFMIVGLLKVFYKKMKGAIS